MNVRSLFSDRQHINKVTSTKLISALYTTDFAKEYFIIEVYAGNTIVQRTGIAKFSKAGLQNVLYQLDLRYQDRVPSVRYALFVFIPKSYGSVETTADLRGPMARKSLKDHERRQIAATMVKTVRAAASGAYRKVNTRPSPGPQAKLSRANPEVRNETWKQVDKTLGFPDSTSSGTKEVYRRSYSSTSTPGFKKKARSGQLPINPHTSDIRSVERGSLSTIYGYRLKVPNFGVSRFETSSTRSTRLTTADVAAVHLPVNDNIVIRRLKSQIGAGVSANAGEDFVQIGQTLRLFTKSVNRLRGLMQLAVLNPRGVKNVLGSSKPLSAASTASLLAELWLEYRYGWIPLLSSIDDYKTVIFKGLAKDPKIFTVKASASRSYNVKTNISVGGPIAQLGPWPGTIRSDTRTKLKIGLQYGFESQIVNTAAQLGLTGPTNLVWNLIPFSFVVDWFLPIGQALESASAFDGLSFKGGYRTRFTKKTVSVVVSGKGTYEDATYAHYASHLDQVNGEGILLTREVLTGFPSASAPRFKNPLSLIHAANAAALLTKFITGRH